MEIVSPPPVKWYTPINKKWLKRIIVNLPSTKHITNISKLLPKYSFKMFSTMTEIVLKLHLSKYIIRFQNLSTEFLYKANGKLGLRLVFLHIQLSSCTGIVFEYTILRSHFGCKFRRNVHMSGPWNNIIPTFPNTKITVEHNYAFSNKTQILKWRILSSTKIQQDCQNEQFIHNPGTEV